MFDCSANQLQISVANRKTADAKTDRREPSETQCEKAVSSTRCAMHSQLNNLFRKSK